MGARLIKECPAEREYTTDTSGRFIRSVRDLLHHFSTTDSLMSSESVVRRKRVTGCRCSNLVVTTFYLATLIIAAIKLRNFYLFEILLSGGEHYGAVQCTIYDVGSRILPVGFGRGLRSEEKWHPISINSLISIVSVSVSIIHSRRLIKPRRSRRLSSRVISLKGMNF